MDNPQEDMPPVEPQELDGLLGTEPARGPAPPKLPTAPEPGRGVEIKFRDSDEGGDVRLVDGRFESDASPQEAERFNQILDEYKAEDCRPVFSRDRQELLADWLAYGQGQGVPDPTMYYRVAVEPGLHAQFVEEVRRLDWGMIEALYPAPTRVPPPSDPDLYTAHQFQLSRFAVRQGIDAVSGWNAGARGQGVRVAIVDYHWNLSHADLQGANVSERLAPAADIRNTAGDGWRWHGTAALGVIAACHSSAGTEAGMRGIAPDAELRMYAADTDVEPEVHVADAIDQARGELRAGDIILVEQQDCDGAVWAGNTLQSGTLYPVERVDSVFTAIQLASNMHIIVVEPAGNGRVANSQYVGGVDLNGNWHTVERGPSQAIVVGAGESARRLLNDPTPQSRCLSSNFGARVNVQGWGARVGTLGVGDLCNPQGEPPCGQENRHYTQGFGGTSAASAIVAGVAAALQSKYKVLHPGQVLTPADMRSRLVDPLAGHPQTGTVAEHIGPLPDLGMLIAAAHLP